MLTTKSGKPSASPPLCTRLGLGLGLGLAPNPNSNPNPNQGFSDANGGGVPSARSVVVAMDADLLVGVFVPEDGGGEDGGVETAPARSVEA